MPAVRRLLSRALRRRVASDNAAYYREQLQRPLDPDLAVYGAYWFRAYSCNPRAIYEKARELVPNARGVWVVRRDALESLPPGVEYVIRGTRPYFVAAARAALGIADGQTTVLYAPTHREYEETYVSRLDLGQLAEALGPRHVILARLHYFYDSDPLVRELHEAGRLLDVATHPSVEELCLAADVLLTDYSSIMFDYAVLDRPIVIHAPDWEESPPRRGVYFDLT